MLGLDEAAVTHHPDQTARRVRAAAKTEYKNLVAFLVLLGQELVALNDIHLQPGANTAADYLIVPFGADAFVVPFNLLYAIRGLRPHRLVKPPHIGFHLPIGRQRLIRRFVPSPIETNNDAFHTNSLATWSDG